MRKFGRPWFLGGGARVGLLCAIEAGKNAAPACSPVLEHAESNREERFSSSRRGTLVISPTFTAQAGKIHFLRMNTSRNPRWRGYTPRGFHRGLVEKHRHSLPRKKNASGQLFLRPAPAQDIIDLLEIGVPGGPGSANFSTEANRGSAAHQRVRGTHRIPANFRAPGPWWLRPAGLFDPQNGARNRRLATNWRAQFGLKIVGDKARAGGRSSWPAKIAAGTATWRGRFGRK